MQCSVAACSDPAITVHGGYAYCDHHQGMVWELPDSDGLSGDQQYRALMEVVFAIDELFGGDDDWDWNEAMNRISRDAVALVRGEFTPPDDDFSAHAVSIWTEMTGAAPPRRGSAGA